jgi:16S rRNA (uracil1498-N3)-methyltransferase
MRLHNFFIDQKLGEVGERALIKDSSLVDQWRSVLRLQVGAQVVLLDNSGFEFVCIILGFLHGDAEVEILEKRESQNIPEKEIFLFPSLIKKDNLEWVIEKGTELGVSVFEPVLSERSEKKSFNFERAKKIAREASEQSGRAVMPEIREVKKLEEAFSENELSFVAFDPRGEEFHKELFDHQKRIGIFVGPEGGWSEREIDFFKQNKIKIFSLGKQILRAETASIAIATLFLIN